jgi:hypothetical protein
MIHEAVTDIKTLFSNMTIIDLDVGQEINTYGNYLVFNALKPDLLMNSGAFNFTLYVALKSLKRGHKNAYHDLDEVIEALSEASEKNIVCDCTSIELNQFGERLFIYAVNLTVTRSW